MITFILGDVKDDSCMFCVMIIFFMLYVYLHMRNLIEVIDSLLLG